MTPQVPVHSPGKNLRQSTFKNIENITAKERRGLGEVAGGTTAACAAVFCCCPCTVINLLLVAVYKVPVGLCRKAVHKKRRRNTLKKKQRDGLFRQRSIDVVSIENLGPVLEDHLWTEVKNEDGRGAPAEKVDEAEVSETCDLEREMLAHFNAAGFWRSPSRQEMEAAVEVKQ